MIFSLFKYIFFAFSCFVFQLSFAQNTPTITGSCVLTLNLNKWGVAASLNSQINSGFLLIMNFDTKQATGFKTTEALSSTNLNNTPIYSTTSTSTLSPPYLTIQQIASEIAGIFIVTLPSPDPTLFPLVLYFAPSNSGNTFIVSTASTMIYGTGVCQKI